MKVNIPVVSEKVKRQVKLAIGFTHMIDKKINH